MSTSLASRTAIHLSSTTRARVGGGIAAAAPCLNTGDALLSALVTHGYAPITHDLFPVDRMVFLTEMGKRLFFEVIPNLDDTEREMLRTSQAFRGLYQYFPLTGKGGKPAPIDCFSFGKETDNPVALRSAYYANNGFELDEYKHKIDRKNPTEALRSLARGSAMPNSTAGDECVAAMVSAFEDFRVVSLDTLQHIAASMGIKPSKDIVRPSPDAQVDERYFGPFHDKCDNNLIFRLHRAIVERQALVDVTIRAGQKQGSAHTAPRVLRRKTAVASNDITNPLIRLKSETDFAQPNTAQSQNCYSSHFSEQQLQGRLSADMPPAPDTDFSTISLLLPDLSGFGLTSSFKEGVAHNPNVGVSGESTQRSVPTAFEIYSEENGTFEPLVLPLSFPSASASCKPCSIPMAVTAGLFLEKWTDGIIPATRYRERIASDTHNKHIYQGIDAIRPPPPSSTDAEASSSPAADTANSRNSTATMGDSSVQGSPSVAFGVQTSLDRCHITYMCVPNYDAVIDPFTADEDYDPNNRGGAAFTVGDIIPHEGV